MYGVCVAKNAICNASGGSALNQKRSERCDAATDIRSGANTSDYSFKQPAASGETCTNNYRVAIP